VAGDERAFYRDGCEAVALVGGRTGEPSSQPVRLWLRFIDTPTPSCWYRAHNASIVAGYLEHESLAGKENAPERFFINVALVRVLYAHALVAAPRLALGRLAWLARLAGDPRFGLTVRTAARLALVAGAVDPARGRTRHSGQLSPRRNCPNRVKRPDRHADDKVNA
jgi:hypothetical protein